LMRQTNRMDRVSFLSPEQMFDDTTTEPFGKDGWCRSSLQRMGRSILESINHKNPSNCGKPKRSRRSKRVSRCTCSESREMLLMGQGTVHQGSAQAVHAAACTARLANQSKPSITGKDAPWRIEHHHMEAFAKGVLPEDSMLISMNMQLQSMPREHILDSVTQEVTYFILRL